MIEKKYASNFYENIMNFIPILFCVSALIGLYLTSLYSYLLFHTFAEMFSIVIAYGIFIVGWSSRKYIKNNYVVFIAIAYFFIATLDMLHTLSYKGMNIFTDYDYYANQLWIATRYMESVTLLVAFLFIGEKRVIRPYLLFSVYAVVTGAIIASIFYWKIFPICFVEGAGLTSFKKGSEYIISGILLVDIFLLRVYKNKFNKRICKQISWSLLFTILSELSFTFYISNYGLSNLVGHYFKIFSFFLIYKAIIETGIDNPYKIIFKELVDKEKLLVRAKTEAEAANRAKSEFLANMSHELRTPLNGILGYAQILSWDAGMGPDQLDGLETIQRSGRHLLNLINEILDMARIEAGKMEIADQPFSLRNFLQNISRMLAIKAQEKEIDFTTVFGENLPQAIVADEKRLGQVLINLLGNAVKFTDHGGVEFCVTVADAGPEAPGGDVRLRFEVRDTGVGVPDDKLEAVFEPFEQLRTPGRSSPGAGLGLAISRKLLSLMDEDLHVSSTLGVGSVFWFELTAGRAAAAGSDAASKRRCCRSYKGPRRKILIVDDDVENRKVLRAALELSGFEILEAGDGEEALEQLAEAAPDLTFMDLVMPGLDGFGAIQKIRSDPKLQDSLVVAATASARISEDAAKNGHGFDSLAFKPLNFDKVLTLVGDLLSLEWNDDASAPHAAARTKTPPSPGADAVELLYDLAKVGDVSGLRDALGELEQSDRKNVAAFIEAARLLLHDFKVKELREWLNRYREEANEV
jgi:signal transduction histidine kinase/CheY-like chemotaxis protein